jgi:regulatory protein
MKIRIRNKTSRTYQIYLDDKIWGVLPFKTLQNFFSPDIPEHEIDDNALDDLREEIIRYAWKRLLDYIAYRERSRVESERFLKNLSVDPGIVGELVKKASSYNYINDERFTEILIEDMISHNKSRNEIRHKLFQAGIKGDLIDQKLGELYNRDVEEDIQLQAVEKAWRRYSGKPEKERYQKTLNYLARKGFRINDIRSNLERLKKVEEGE